MPPLLSIMKQRQKHKSIIVNTVQSALSELFGTREKCSLYPRFTLTIMAKIGKNARSSEKLLELATLVHIEQWIIMSVQNEWRGIIFF